MPLPHDRPHRDDNREITCCVGDEVIGRGADFKRKENSRRKGRAIKQEILREFSFLREIDLKSVVG